jgi:hypothetical protein
MKQRARELVVAAAAVLLVLSASSVVRAAQATRIDITGAWLFDVVTDQAPGTPTVTFKQDGEKITGHYSSQTLGEADLTGTLKGQDLTFTFSADVQGTTVPVVYKGTVESKDSMKGTLDIAGGLVGGTFTAKRK